MNRVVKILMKRDDLTEQEATELLDECREALADCKYDIQESEDIIQDYLGLEPDYIFDILNFEA